MALWSTASFYVIAVDAITEIRMWKRPCHREWLREHSRTKAFIMFLKSFTNVKLDAFTLWLQWLHPQQLYGRRLPIREVFSMMFRMTKMWNRNGPRHAAISIHVISPRCLERCPRNLKRSAKSVERQPYHRRTARKDIWLEPYMRLEPDLEIHLRLQCLKLKAKSAPKTMATQPAWSPMHRRTEWFEGRYFQLEVITMPRHCNVSSSDVRMYKWNVKSSIKRWNGICNNNNNNNKCNDVGILVNLSFVVQLIFYNFPLL